jgi:Holliday junction resolvasome RuvABC DNA-binding subunit
MLFVDTVEPAPQQTSSGQEPSADQISALADMGFTSNQARKALRETVRGSLLDLKSET